MTSRGQAYALAVSSRPPDVVAPPPGNPRFPLLDPLRAVAALCIVVTHTAGWSGFNAAHALGAWTARLDCGVAIFFVLSGFLLYRPFVAARLDGRDRPRVARYARRRALRILPAYWTALIVVAVLLPRDAPGVFGSHWWAYFGLVQSWSSATIIGGLSVAWSLSVEAAFYVLLPVYALVMARLLRGRSRDDQARVELAVLAVTGVLAVAMRTVVHVADPDTVYLNTLPGTWAWFCGGLSLAVLSAWAPERLRPAREHPYAFWAAAFALLTVAAWGAGLPRVLGETYRTVPLAAEHVLYLGIAVCLVAPGTAQARLPLLRSRPLVWLGLVSYGIFLYHQPLVGRLIEIRTHVPFAGYVWYTLAVAAAATACAAASYYLVERPLLRFKEPQRARGTGGSSARARARAFAAKPES
jgi:peptidoglycan/LPS O-acetylase OafA/YrhL